MDNHETVDFQDAVIDRSRQVPVVVDFWAAWCGPCRSLGPVIEDLAGASAGRWELVKLNTEEQPDIASQFGIRSIPAVKMFHRGAVVAEFVGALPREAIVRWLETNLPDPRLDRLGTIVGEWASRGPHIGPALERFVQDHPDFPLARLRLAQAIVGTEPARAREMVQGSAHDLDHEDLVDDIASLADLMELTEKASPRLAPHLEGARRAFGKHDLDGALEHLVQAAMIDKRFAGELPRRAAVAIFRLLGQRHELTEKHQRGLSMALHS